MRDKTETIKKYGAAFAGFIHSHLIPVMRGKMTYKEYYKQVTAAVSYWELGHATRFGEVTAARVALDPILLRARLGWLIAER